MDQTSVEVEKDQKSVKCDYLDPEYLMDSAGSWNRYQAFQTSLFVMSVIFFTYSHYLPILFLYTPDHYCLIPGGEKWNLTEEEMKRIFIPQVQNQSHYEKCVQFDVNISDVLENNIREPNITWPITKCKNGWHYELEGYYNSVSSEFDFVCDNSWKGPLTDTIYFIGCAFGMIINGWIGDHFGRFWSIIVCNGLTCLTGLVLGFSPNFVFFTIIRFIMGLFTITGVTSFFVIAMEYVSKDRRTFIGNFAFGVGIALGGLIMPGLLYSLKDWRLVNHAMFGQGLLTLILPFTLHESIRWLLEREQFERVLKTLEAVSKFNGIELDKNIVLNLNNLAKPRNEDISKSHTEDNKVVSVLNLFKTPRLRRHFILMIIVWSMITILFETYLRSMKNLEVHVYYSFMISNFLEFLAGIIVIWTMEWFGRRWMCAFSSILSGTAMFIAAYIKVTTNHEIILLGLSMFGRFCSSMLINIGMQFQFEVCPTDLRARGSGIILFCGGLLSFISPYIVHTSTYYLILPQLILGFGGFVIGLLSLLLPETAGIDLPANSKEAEDFGCDTSFFYVPILKNRYKSKKS